MKSPKISATVWRGATTLVALNCLFISACERPAAPKSPPAATQAASKPTARRLPSVDEALAEMNSLLASPPADGSIILERAEVWTQIADLCRNAPAHQAALRERTGVLLAGAGRPDAAIPQLRQALEIRAGASAPSSGMWTRCNAATAMLAEALLVVGATSDAEVLLRDAIGPLPVAGPGESPATQPAPNLFAIECAYWLAEVLRVTHRPHEALPLVESALAGLAASQGAANADQTLLSRIQKTRVLAGLARVTEALPEIEEIHQTCVRQRGAHDWLAQVAALALGEIESRVGGRVQAGWERMASTAPALVASLPPTSWWRIDGVARCVEVLEFRREWDRAESVLRATLAALEAEKRPMPPSFVPAARLALARDLVRQQKLADAQTLAEAAIQELQSVATNGSAVDDFLADALLVAADIARRRKQFPEAHHLCNQAQEVCTRTSPERAASVCTALCRVQRGWIMLHEDDFTGAEEELKDAVPTLRENLGDSDWRAGLARLILGEVRFKQVRLEEAEEDVVYGTRIVVGRRGPDEDGLRALRLCVELYETWGNSEMATHYRRMLPESHSHDENGTGE